jgi:predicted enzyme related to lactoylglutathione lyase
VTIQKLSHSSVYVLDQDKALQFYTQKLGLKVRTDAAMGNFRWITLSPVEQSDFELVLMPLQPGPMMDAKTVEMLRELVKKGTFGAGVFETDDVRGTYEDFKKKGVEFLSPPAERPYGIEAVFKDDSGNWFSLCQRKK